MPLKVTVNKFPGLENPIIDTHKTKLEQNCNECGLAVPDICEVNNFHAAVEWWLSREKPFVLIPGRHCLVPRSKMRLQPHYQPSSLSTGWVIPTHGCKTILNPPLTKFTLSIFSNCLYIKGKRREAEKDEDRTRKVRRARFLGDRGDLGVLLQGNYGLMVIISTTGVWFTAWVFPCRGSVGIFVLANYITIKDRNPALSQWQLRPYPMWRETWPISELSFKWTVYYFTRSGGRVLWSGYGNDV